MWEEMDSTVRKHYPNGLPKTKARSQEEVLSDYLNPWAAEWLSRHDDLQPAPLTGDFNYQYDCGEMPVAAYGTNTGFLGVLIFGLTATGEVTVSIRSLYAEERHPSPAWLREAAD